MRSAKALLAGLATLGFAAGDLSAEIRMPHLFTDHAVLQRDRPLRIWGWAAPGATLRVRFHEQSVAVIAAPDSRWEATLRPEAAGGPYTLQVDGDGHAEVTDILVGDVWLASGQSNMEMPLKGFGPKTPVNNSAQEIAAANHPRIRLLHVARHSAAYPMADVTGTWARCSPETAASFSAVAYFFGREVEAKEHIPIGLIESDWGGTPADPWVSMDTLGSDARLLPAFRARADFAAAEADANTAAALAERNDRAAVAAGKPAPEHPWRVPQESWIPAALYNGMIAPLTPYSLRGFLWYQGETNSNADRADAYATLFPALIQDWRMHFGQGDLPFLFAQISSVKDTPQHRGEVRDAQRRALSLRNTAMAVTLDVGSPTNVHAPDKQTVGHRLALAARGQVYGEAVAFQSPTLRQVTPEPGALRIWFDHADGLTSRGRTLEGFEIAGSDRHFVPAQAALQGETVLVTAPGIATPLYVRYLWQNFPPAPLYNGGGLPASTFSSEWFPSGGVTD